MTTTFVLSHDSKIFELFAERVSVTEELETWRVCNRGDTNRFITLSNNRPYLHSRHQYKAFYKWTVIEGDHSYRRIRDLITNKIEYHIKGLWKPPTKAETTKNAPVKQSKLF